MKMPDLKNNLTLRTHQVLSQFKRIMMNTRISKPKKSIPATLRVIYSSVKISMP